MDFPMVFYLTVHFSCIALLVDLISCNLLSPLYLCILLLLFPPYLRTFYLCILLSRFADFLPVHIAFPAVFVGFLQCILLSQPYLWTFYQCILLSPSHFQCCGSGSGIRDVYPGSYFREHRNNI